MFGDEFSPGVGYEARQFEDQDEWAAPQEVVLELAAREVASQGENVGLYGVVGK